jgi:hypothetical protein
MTLAIAFCRAAALCLLAGSAYAGTVPAADPNAPVPATRYQPTAWETPAPPSATPAAAWREQNRIVAAYDSMSLTMPAHGGHAAHAGHKMPAAAEPHAGHGMHTDAAHAGPGNLDGCCQGGEGGSCCKDGCSMAAAPAAPAHHHGGHH